MEQRHHPAPVGTRIRFNRHTWPIARDDGSYSGGYATTVQNTIGTVVQVLPQGEVVRDDRAVVEVVTSRGVTKRIVWNSGSSGTARVMIQPR